MNWLYYNGRFGWLDQVVTIPWGTGPVLTVGKACISAERKPGAQDLLVRNEEGFILNNHEPGVIAPVIHQFDRCHPWIMQFLQEKRYIYGVKS